MTVTELSNFFSKRGNGMNGRNNDKLSGRISSYSK